MATHNLTIVKSDLSGVEDATTVSFGIKGTWYDIDLTKEEQAELEETLRTYVKAGRKAAAKSQKNHYMPDTTQEERDKIRTWAQEQGMEVSERGRIPKKVVAAYVKANGPIGSAS